MTAATARYFAYGSNLAPRIIEGWCPGARYLGPARLDGFRLAFLRRSHRSVVIADSSKIGRVTFARISHLSEVRDLITDTGASPEQLDRLRRAGVRVQTV